MKANRCCCQVYLNTKANAGAGLKRWNANESRLLAMLPSTTEIVKYASPFDVAAHLKSTIANTEQDVLVVAAGGDGTVNFVVNAIMELCDVVRSRVTLGAIGLGSSNDFQKPFTRSVNDVPCRLAMESARLSDVGMVDYRQANGAAGRRHFIVNASLGFTAEANQLFNQGDPFINTFKHRMVHLAIWYTALRKLATHKNVPVRISCDRFDGDYRLTNLNILKRCHVSGNLRYRPTIEPDDGLFGIKLCHNMKLWKMFQTLLRLQRGEFRSGPTQESVSANSLSIESQHDLVLELDGEIRRANTMRFAIKSRALNVLQG